MDRYLGQIWAVPSLVKPDGKKLKKKLQKVGGAQGPAQRPYSVNYSDTKASPGHKSRRSSIYLTLFGSSAKTNASSQPSSPPLGKQRHSVWAADYGELNYPCRDDRLSRVDYAKTRERPSSVVIVPEFVHLAMAGGVPSTPELVPKTPLANDNSSIATVQTRRRYAKTPVLHIGQLEAQPMQPTHDMSQNGTRAESIAESYTALLESRNPYMNEATIEVPEIPVIPGESYSPQQPSLMASPIIQPAIELAELPRPRQSPRSDDGTLVASEEDSSKSVPASSAPSSPSCSNQGAAPPGPEDENVTSSTHTPDLKLGLDLLTRELLSTFNGSPSQSTADTSAFQVYLMIEAYEKLRDQILETHEPGVNEAPLKAMFDTWLKALHSVHDGMTGADGQRSESNYGD